MINFKFDEARDIKNIVESNLLDFSHIRKAIWYMTLYFMKIKNVPDDRIFDSVVSYLQLSCPDFRYEGYIKAIDDSIKRAKKYNLKKIDKIQITKSEMNIITSFNDIRKEKIVFVLVAIAKYMNASGNNQNNFVFAKTSEIFKYARVSIPAQERDYYYSFVYDNNILKENFNIGHNMQIVNIISQDDSEEIALQLDEFDYKELAYAYLNYKNGGYARCAKCGRWYKKTVIDPEVWYCHLHIPKNDKEVKKEEHKKIRCEDCGKEFYVPIKNNRSCRCDYCQNEKDKRSKLAWWNKNHNESYNTLELSSDITIQD